MVKRNKSGKLAKKSKDESFLDLDADGFMNTFTDDPPDKDNLPTVKLQKIKNKTKDENPRKKKRKIKEAGPDETDGHTTGSDVKKGLSHLAETDSEFFKFLQENDPELLNFSGDDSDDVEGGSDSSDDEHVSTGEHVEEEEEEGGVLDDIAPEMEEALSSSIPVTTALIRKWERGLAKNSLVQWKQLVKAFQSAVATARGSGDDEVELKYAIIDPDLINKVIMMCLYNTSDVLKHNLGEDDPTKSSKWNKVKVSLKTYLTCLTDLLGLLTSNDLLCAVMRHCKAMLPYFAVFSRHVKRYMKAYIAIWGSKAELSKVVAFTGLQALVRRLPSFLEEVLKKVYVEYGKCSKVMNVRTRDSIILMRNCLVELFKINPALTYNTGFIYIRQLAITLRSAVTNKKKKEADSVYNWQYVNSLHLWVGVLSDCDSCLQPLIYPLVQIMLGVVKLHSSPCHLPLHLHVIRLLLHLGEQTNKHIPLVHPLIGVLDFCAVQSRAPSTKPIDLSCVLRVTKGYKKTKAYQDGIFDMTYELLLNYCAQLSRSISFPEVSFPVVLWLKKWLKKCDSGKYKSLIKQLLEKIDQVSKTITSARSSVSFSPKDFKEVDKWEEEQPVTVLTTYFNTWLKLHRAVKEKEQNAAREADGKNEDNNENGDDAENEDDAESDLEEVEREVDGEENESRATVAEGSDEEGAEDSGEDADDIVEDIVFSD